MSLSLICSSCYSVPCYVSRSEKSSVLALDFVPCSPNLSNLRCGTICMHNVMKNRHPIVLKCTSSSSGSNSSSGGFVTTDYDPSDKEDASSFVWGGEVKIDDAGSPWEGAVIYRRNASVSHVEYCTTLERLGMGNLSTDISKSRASVMGLRVTKSVEDYPLGTPVQISIDVTRKKQKIRLDGIVKTVLTLGCNRCGGSAAKSIFSNFSLLLTEEPIEEPETISLGVMFGEDKQRDDDDEASIDMDDWLYFPPEEKEIDISKHIRDLIHIEITINAICDPSCKGLCLNCGTNFNIGTCSCSAAKVTANEKSSGPLGNLKKQMQEQ